MRLLLGLTVGLIVLTISGATAGSSTGLQAPKAASVPQATTQAASPHMVHVFLCLLQAGPKRALAGPEAEQALFDHFDHLKGLMKSGKGLITGPVEGDPRLKGILVLRAASLDEAKATAASDPAVKAGIFVAEVHPWFMDDTPIKPVYSPGNVVPYFFGFLNKGPNWTPGTTPQTERIQEGHMAHLREFAKSGKLVAAGPLEDNGFVRGIVIYKTASVEEARAIAMADPAVKAGRFMIVLHKWFVTRGALP